MYVGCNHSKLEQAGMQVCVVLYGQAGRYSHEAQRALQQAQAAGLQFRGPCLDLRRFALLAHDRGERRLQRFGRRLAVAALALLVEIHRRGMQQHRDRSLLRRGEHARRDAGVDRHVQARGEREIPTSEGEHRSGNVLASVNVTFNPNGPVLPFDYTVTTNNLPNQQVMANGVLTQAQLNTIPGTSGTWAAGGAALNFGTASAADRLTGAATLNSVAALSQDGSSIGSLVSFSIGQDGLISGVFSNGRTQALGQIALASFADPAGLLKQGGSLFTTSANSGVAQIGAAVDAALAGINGVKHMISSIQDGVSSTAIEFRLEISADRAVNDVKDAIARIRAELAALRHLDRPHHQRVVPVVERLHDDPTRRRGDRGVVRVPVRGVVELGAAQGPQVDGDEPGRRSPGGGRGLGVRRRGGDDTSGERDQQREEAARGPIVLYLGGAAPEEPGHERLAANSPTGMRKAIEGRRRMTVEIPWDSAAMGLDARSCRFGFRTTVVAGGGFRHAHPANQGCAASPAANRRAFST